jgi:DNA-binding NtrC family response regulator
MLQFTMDCPFCKVRFRAGGNLKEMMDQVERHIITEAMARAEGNRTQAAKDLGIEVWAMRHLLMKHGIIPQKKSKKNSNPES